MSLTLLLATVVFGVLLYGVDQLRAGAMVKSLLKAALIVLMIEFALHGVALFRP